MHTYSATQKIPISLEQAWDFFSSPKNLSLITPPEMRFEIQSEVPEKMYSGLFIQYKVRPLMNIPTTWVTEIKHVEEPLYFVDEQIEGPYTVWHHQHFFKVIDGGIEMTDIVDYKIPMGIIGKFMNRLFIRKKINAIFEYRRKKLIELFGEIKY
ncbi:MAG: SRPBCC family protein [Flavobacteriales bacterium]|nr:SRPBCC family protein [Flavobacteriales bacterium]